MWAGTEKDVLTLLREPAPEMWEADPTVDPGGGAIAILRTLDEKEQETGQVAGVEIVGFLEFDRWRDIPRLPILWQLAQNEPLPLHELLKRTQRELKQVAAA